MQDVLLEDLRTLNTEAKELLDRDIKQAHHALQQAFESWNAAFPPEIATATPNATLVNEYCTSVILMTLILMETERHGDVPGLLLQVLDYADEYALPLHRAESLRLLGVYNVLHGEQTQAEVYFGRAAKAYNECGDTIGRAKVLANIGNIALLRSEYEKAIAHYVEVLSIVEKNQSPHMEISVRKALGDAYLDTGDYAYALEYYIQALSIAEERNELQGNSYILDGLGNLYEVIGDFDTALEYYRRAFSLIEEGDNQYSYGGTLHNIGTLFKRKGDYVQACAYLRQALQHFRAVQDDNGIAHCYVNLATAEMQCGNVEEGYHYAKKGLEHAKSVGARKMIAGAYAALGLVAVEAMERDIESPVCMKEAVEHIEQALNIACEGTMHETEMQTHQIASRYYKSTGNFEQALYHTVRHYELEKEIITRYNKHRMEVMQMQMRISAHRSENEILRGKNHELGIALENVRRLNRHLEQLNQEKNEFLGIASHDLKNPLSVIRMEAEYILSRLDSLSRDELLQFMSNIRESSLRMFALVEELLNVNAIEQGTLSSNIQPCDVEQIVRIVVMQQMEHARRKNIAIDVDCQKLSMALADEVQLQQVVDNLLSNALKFSPYDATVRVIVEQNNHEGKLCLRVQDFGQGLSDEDKSKLFQKFQRLSARPTAGEHSTGLGLSIVKKLVEMMKGSIHCHSQQGEGATFIVELPLANTAA